MALKSRKGYLDSKEGQDVRRIFQSMTFDNLFNTAPSYSTDTVLYPDHMIPFIDKHMNYLNTHPQLDADLYVANVKLVSRIR
jgi:hypothetical protein